MKDKKKLIKGIGILSTLLGLGLNLLTDWVDEQKMNEAIEEKVNKAFAEKEEEEPDN